MKEGRGRNVSLVTVQIPLRQSGPKEDSGKVAYESKRVKN